MNILMYIMTVINFCTVLTTQQFIITYNLSVVQLGVT